ncbi:protein yellow-like [Cloeon dipterum]|uniref:protein yellow-like n=1 Tax=Cloeon dipterum TaxID=197152 RepID=UPI0032209261
MVPSFCALFFLGLSSLATAVNFTQVFEWPDDWDYEWPSEGDGTFKPQNIQPIYMAVYETRIFLSLDRYYDGIPVTLVSLPTSSASSASPKLTLFPSWEMQEFGHCNKIEEAKGLEVDSIGRLWVVS